MTFQPLGVVAGMVGMAYASVPLYDLFCRVTGFGGNVEPARGDALRHSWLRRAIGALEKAGELDNTLILFVSDNGACPYDRRSNQLDAEPTNGSVSVLGVDPARAGKSCRRQLGFQLGQQSPRPFPIVRHRRPMVENKGQPFDRWLLLPLCYQ